MIDKCCAAALVMFACGRADMPAHDVEQGTDAHAGSPPPRVSLPTQDSTEPFWLSQTGLYEDISTKTLARDLITYEPRYTLWSDGADKRRYLRLPREAQIDTSDMDHWQFPVGTMLWKEFAQGTERLETRLIVRTGTGPNDYFMAAFAWNEAQSDALLVRDGQPNVLGTPHDVPSVKACGNCHNGEPGRILGVSAIQNPALPDRLLSQVPEHNEIPGNEAARHALGYLHANCAHCHNPQGLAWPDTDLNLRLTVSESSLENTAFYRSTVNVIMTDPKLRKHRVLPGDPAASGVYHRMSQRGPKLQMPPIATEQIDEQGLKTIAELIRSLR